MGPRLSCPSDALDAVWIDDKDAAKCFNCGIDFTMRRRRHHCRACGGVFCLACWGTQTNLEEAYGFPGAVPVCTVCADVIMPDGQMHLLKRGIQVAFTHEARTAVTSTSQIPPLANANIKARKFTTNNIRLYHWRPFTRRTLLQLAKSRSSKEILRSRSSGLTPRTPRESALSREQSPDNCWTIDLQAVESIQLLSFSEKDGGEFICISTDFEEHRLQAVKVRFEEVYIPSTNSALETSSAASGGGASTLSPEPPGGESANAADRRSAISTGTRLRTVMLDKNGTRALYNALLKAHQACQRRAQFVPPEVRAFVEVDTAAEEDTGSQPTTPRAGTRGSSASVTDEVTPIADRTPRIRHSIV